MNSLIGSNRQPHPRLTTSFILNGSSIPRKVFIPFLEQFHHSILTQKIFKIKMLTDTKMHEAKLHATALIALEEILFTYYRTLMWSQIN